METNEEGHIFPYKIVLEYSKTISKDLKSAEEEYIMENVVLYANY